MRAVFGAAVCGALMRRYSLDDLRAFNHGYFKRVPLWPGTKALVTFAEELKMWEAWERWGVDPAVQRAWARGFLGMCESHDGRRVTGRRGGGGHGLE